MKNKIVIILICIAIFVLGGCSNKKTETAQNVEEGFDIKTATNVVDNYITYLSKEDYENVKKLCSKELLKNTKFEKVSNLKIRGYSVAEINEIGRMGIFKVNVTRGTDNAPYACLDEYSIRIAKENNEYKVNAVEDVINREAFIEGDEMRIRMKNNIKNNLIMDKSGIPQYGFGKDDKANVFKLPVPKNNFGIMTFGYEGDNIIITTYDNNSSFLGVAKIDETLAVQAPSQNDNTSGGKGEEIIQKGKEKPIGKEMMALDLLKNSKIQFTSFAPGEKFIVAQYMRDGVGKCIRVYKSDNGELIAYKFEENYPIDKVDVVFSSFGKDIINYEVLAKSSIDKSASELLGKYQMNLKDFKVKKM